MSKNVPLPALIDSLCDLPLRILKENAFFRKWMIST